MRDQDNSVSSIPSSKRSYRGCSTIGDYDLLRKLGEGTFGYVLAYGDNHVRFQTIKFRLSG